ncbi:hypothetical protein BgiBS90_028779, partial [Biomphalaria glabrata]
KYEDNPIQKYEDNPIQKCKDNRIQKCKDKSNQKYTLLLQMEITWKGSDFNVYTRNGSNSVILSSVLRWPSIQLIVDCKKDQAMSGSRNKTMGSVEVTVSRLHALHTSYQ